jgi:hypothetical protein
MYPIESWKNIDTTSNAAAKATPITVTQKRVGWRPIPRRDIFQEEFILPTKADQSSKKTFLPWIGGSGRMDSEGFMNTIRLAASQPDNNPTPTPSSKAMKITSLLILFA